MTERERKNSISHLYQDMVGSPLSNPRQRAVLAAELRVCTQHPAPETVLDIRIDPVTVPIRIREKVYIFYNKNQDH